VREYQELLEELKELKSRLKEVESRNAELCAKNAELCAENAELKKLLNEQGALKGAKRPQFKEDYSVEKSKGKRKSGRGSQATGRLSQEEKEEQVSHDADIYESGVAKEECVEERQQYAWRFMEGRAAYVCYHLHGLPGTKALPSVPGVRNSRSEYGIEILLTVAFLHYWIGLSLDHVCEVVGFFTGLSLTKSQGNSLLEQLSRDWEEEYETIAELLSYQMVIYIDETGWKVGKKACYSWAFSTMQYVLFRCGVSRSKSEAQAVLGEEFKGIGVTDDYAAYQSMFTEHQLCWAHLLRKAIKLMLQNPTESVYREFLDDLYDLYQESVRWQKDQRLSVGRPAKVESLKAEILALCTRSGEVPLPQMPIHEQTFIRLQNELVRGINALFVFVAHPEVEATNNRSERNVRREAEVRKGGRTSKSPAGANRRGIIMTVLATLNTRFERFTLNHLMDEIRCWAERGISTFQAELANFVDAIPPPVT
jgi:transposase